MPAAARTMRVNLSTVQRRIASLERAVDRKLIEKQPGGYRLTPAGADLFPAVEAVETAVAAVERRLAAASAGPTGILRLTCGSALAGLLQRSGMIADFQSRHPGLAVELLVSDRILDLSRGEADIAIRRGAPEDGALVGRKIADVPWSVYASPTYLDRHGRPRDTLDGHFVVGCDGPIATYPGGQWARAVVPPARVATRSDSWQGLVLAVKSGAGLAAMPRWQGDREPSLTRVIEDIGLSMPYYLLMHSDMRHTPRVRAFADFVASEIEAFRHLLAGN